MATLRTTWALDDLADLRRCRRDLVDETAEPDGSFSCREGPFTVYRRTLGPDGPRVTETTHYRIAVPWFAWLFALPVRSTLRHRPNRRQSETQPWWAPPDRLDARAATALGLLAAASLIVGYVNTLFTQTVTFAAKEYGVSDGGQSVAGALVRVGVVFTLPIVFAADRIGRRMATVGVAIAGPLLSVLGAVAPSFALLTASQMIARPMALALDILVAITAAEEMPRSSRAYAVSVLSLASGLGAGFAVMALPLADIGTRAWRLVYVLPIGLMVFAVSLRRHLPETRRFVAPHAESPAMNRGRLGIIAAAAFFGNIFIAPASFFQNNYLKKVRHYSARLISAFTLVTATPVGIGVMAGGRVADVRGRRRLAAVGVVVSTILLVASFTVGGWPMWLTALTGGIAGGAAYPALAVYRTELFPTGNRGRAGGLITAAALAGGSIGLLVTGALRDSGVGFGPIMAGLGLGEIVVAVIVVKAYPETAHHELEDLNPEDVIPTAVNRTAEA